MTRQSRVSQYLSFAIITLLASIYSSNSLAADETAPLAVDGYDVVSYFTAHKAQKGNTSHEIKHGGKTYRFISKEHMALFTKDPAKYLPQYDGYCAYGVLNGTKAKADRAVWTIVHDKLYLTGDRDGMNKWKKNQEESVRQSDDQWDLIKDIPEKDL